MLFRSVESKSELGLRLTEIMSSGELVSDEIVTELLRKRLIEKDTETGFILDGYPRNIAQAKILDDLLITLGKKIGAAIYLDMDVDTAMHRALGRLSCPECGRGYNKYEEATKPKNEGFCDDCNIALTSRSDDTEETFKIRFNAYIENTEPLLDYYKELGILNVIDNSGTPSETSALIESVIK